MPGFRKPTAPPLPSDIADRDRWEALTSSSLATTQAAAEKWRAGLAAFVTLVVGGLLLKGPESANKLTTGWRATLSILAGAGLAAAIVGLWLALRAAAGSPGRVNYSKILAAYGGVRQFEIAAAGKASEMLRWAKVAVGTALVLLGTAAIAWWWAPGKSADPPALFKVTATGSVTCGELLTGDNQQVRVQVNGETGPRTIPFADVLNLVVVPKC